MEIYYLNGELLRTKSSGCTETDLLQKLFGGDPSNIIPKIFTKNALSQLLQEESTIEIFEIYEDHDACKKISR